MDNPLISIIVPVYNLESIIKKCVDSILKQRYKNLEIILIDDGSTDNSGGICDEYAKRDKRIVVFHQKNSGIAAVRNLGISKANGDYVSFIDGDDYVDDDYIQSLYNALSGDNSDIAICGHIIIYPSKKYIKKSDKKLILTAEEAVREVLYDKYLDLSPWGKLYAKELFRGIKYPSGMLFEDSAVTPLILAKATRVSVIPKAHYYYVKQESHSITNASFNSKKLDLITATKQMTNTISMKYPNLKQACARRMMWAHLSTLSVMATSKNVPKKSIRLVYEYIKKNRSNILKDPNISKRDRFGLLISRFGYRGYKIIWSLYDKTRK